MTDCEFLKTVGRNIQKVRQEKGVKGETLAKELGVKKAYLSQMENGLVDFRISVLQQIASFLEINFSCLVGEEHNTESTFDDYRFLAEQHLRTINMLVCRIEYLNEQTEFMRLSKAG